MKTNRNNGQRSAFTLIEMVGVLAVIAILAALLVPKIFAAINDSRFSNSVASINSCKTATMDYFGKKGNFGADAAAMAAFDGELVKENCLERPLACKVATTAVAEVVAITTGPSTGVGGVYTLIGTTNYITGGKVVQLQLDGVLIEDAWELSRRIDGEPALGLTNAKDSVALDIAGRVTYAAATAGNPTVVYIYIAHK